MRARPVRSVRSVRSVRVEDGTASAELVVLVVPIMVLVAFAVFVGRYSATNQEVTSAARDAARAAAVQGTPGAAQRAGESAAVTSLADRAVSCLNLTTTIDTSLFQPGGQVTAEVTCRIGLADIAGFGLPGSREVTASATSVVDTYRGGDRP